MNHRLFHRVMLRGVEAEQRLSKKSQAISIAIKFLGDGYLPYLDHVVVVDEGAVLGVVVGIPQPCGEQRPQPLVLGKTLYQRA